MKSLFDLTSEALAIESLLEEMGGEIPDAEIEAAIDRILAEHADDLHAKLDGYVALIASYQAHAEVRRAEAKRYQLLAQEAEHKEAKLKERLLLLFERTGRTKVETAHHKISVVKNGGKQPLILLGESAEQLPEEFRIVTYSPDKDAIRAALDSGAQLEFAVLCERGTSLRIR